jgi:hypothetical protein
MPYPSHLIGFMILIISDKDKFIMVTLRNLQPPTISSLLGPNILLGNHVLKHP